MINPNTSDEHFVTVSRQVLGLREFLYGARQDCLQILGEKVVGSTVKEGSYEVDESTGRAAVERVIIPISASEAEVADANEVQIILSHRSISSSDILAQTTARTVVRLKDRDPYTGRRPFRKKRVLGKALDLALENVSKEFGRPYHHTMYLDQAEVMPVDGTDVIYGLGLMQSDDADQPEITTQILERQAAVVEGSLARVNPALSRLNPQASLSVLFARIPGYTSELDQQLLLAAFNQRLSHHKKIPKSVGRLLVYNEQIL